MARGGLGVSGNPSGFLRLGPRPQCQEASGLKGERERNAVGRKRLIPCPAEQASLSERVHRISDKHMVNVEPQLTLLLGENRKRESFSNSF